MSANLIERNGPGADTLYITLSESVTSSLFAGQNSLLLIKHQGQTQVPLNVLSAVKIDNAIRLVVADAGANSPEGVIL
jgi:guanylate kinase